MAYVIHDVREREWLSYFKDQHVEVIVEFKYNGVPVDVANPEFKVYNSANQEVPVYILKPLQPSDPPVVGCYHATFMVTNLTQGDYFFVARGFYNNNEIVVNGSFKLVEVPRRQWFIDTLRGILADKYQIEVPWEFWTHDPTKREWRDGQLNDYLEQAVRYINVLPPATVQWVLETVPCSSLVLLGAQIFALLSKDIMEVHNYFDYSTPVKVSVYRGREYRSIYQWIEKMFTEPAKRFKVSYVLNTMRPKAIVFPRIAFRVMRPLSMVLHFTSYGL